MPERIPLLTLTLVHTWYEESTPKNEPYLQTSRLDPSLKIHSRLVSQIGSIVMSEDCREWTEE